MRWSIGPRHPDQKSNGQQRQNTLLVLSVTSSQSASESSTCRRTPTHTCKEVHVIRLENSAGDSLSPATVGVIGMHAGSKTRQASSELTTGAMIHRAASINKNQSLISTEA